MSYPDVVIITNVRNQSIDVHTGEDMYGNPEIETVAPGDTTKVPNDTHDRIYTNGTKISILKAWQDGYIEMS